MPGKVDDQDIGGLIEKLAKAQGAAKALAVGAPDHHAWIVSLARALPENGMLIVFYPDAAGMRGLREKFERAGVAKRTNVMLGHPALLVRKVAGPFEIVLNCEPGDDKGWRQRLIPLVAAGGLFVSAWEDGILIDAR